MSQNKKTNSHSSKTIHREGGGGGVKVYIFSLVQFFGTPGILNKHRQKLKRF